MKNLGILVMTLCFSLSLFANNNIKEPRSDSNLLVDGGVISTSDQTTFIVNDGLSDLIEFELNNAQGDDMIWVVVDSAENVLFYDEDGTIDFEGTGPGTCFVYHLAMGLGTIAADIGTNYLSISGNFDYSNAIEITRTEENFSDQQICANPEIAVHFDLEDCRSYIGSSDMDYSEFVASYPENPSCGNYSVIEDHLYRLNPQENKHSCTPGIDGNVAMCIMSMDGCAFVPDHEQAIRFDIQLTPEEDETIYLSGLQFYEQAPENFIWIFGETGPNNYPQYYGLRVLRDGQEVFLQENIKTELDWNLEFFDFTKRGAFKVEEPAVFSFELLAYCRVGDDIDMAVWDIDEISILSCCELCDVEGGDIATQTASILCDNSGQSQDIEIQLTEGTGDTNLLLILDDQGNILSFQEELTIEPSSINSESIFVQSISFSGELNGLYVGAHISELSGCFQLSNELEFIKFIPDGGELSSGSSLDICSGDGYSDLVEFVVSDNKGNNSFFLITDNFGIVTDVTIETNYNFEGSPSGVCTVFHVSAYGDLAGLEIGGNISNLIGCFDLSNPLQITKTYVSGGTISTDDETVICSGDGIGNMVTFELNGAVGNFGLWIITDPSGSVVRASIDNVFEFEGIPTGNCLTRYASFVEEPTLPLFGDDIFSMEGCYSLSNAIEVVKTEVDGGLLTSSDLLYQCENSIDGITFNIELTDPIGTDSLFFLTDTLGNIVDIYEGSITSFLVINEGIFHFWHFRGDGDVEGIEQGNNLSELSGCYDLSNHLVVENYQMSGGIISTDDSTIICSMPGMETELSFMVAEVLGEFNQWLVTTVSGEILELSETGDITFTDTGLEVCIVVHLSYNDESLMLEEGMNINDFSGCFDLSNPIIISKDVVSPATISTDDPTNYCLADGETVKINVELTDMTSANGLFLLTDFDGLIIDTFETNIVEVGAGLSECLIWHISYPDIILGAEAGFNINDIAGCFAESTPITITKEAGGTASISTIGPTEICAGDGLDEIIVIDVDGALGPEELFIVTDLDSNILYTQLENMFSFENAESGSCLIWHLSFQEELDTLGLTNLNQLDGCSSLSNFIEIIKDSSIPGVIGIEGDNTICLKDQLPDMVNLTINGGSSENELWLLTNIDGQIIDLSSGGSFSFSALTIGEYFIWHIGFSIEVTGAVVGGNINDIDGCFALSNNVSVFVESPEGGFAFPTSQTMFCLIDDIPDTLSLSVIDVVGASSDWLLVDTTGIVLQVSDIPEFIIDGASPEECIAYHLSTLNEDFDISVGFDIDDIEDCHSLSNSVTVSKFLNEAGSVSTIDGTDMVEICVSDTEADTVKVQNLGAIGNNYSYIVTDVNDVILFSNDGPEIIFPENSDEGTCKIWGLSYEGIDTPFPGSDVVSSSLATICFDLSNNFILVEKVSDGHECTTILPKTLEYDLFPNPASTFLELRITNLPFAFGEIELFDSYGRPMFKRKVFDEGVENIDLTKLTPGVYLLKIVNGPYKSIEKLLVK